LYKVRIYSIELCPRRLVDPGQDGAKSLIRLQRGIDFVTSTTMR